MKRLFVPLEPDEIADKGQQHENEVYPEQLARRLVQDKRAAAWLTSNRTNPTRYAYSQTNGEFCGKMIWFGECAEGLVLVSSCCPTVASRDTLPRNRAHVADHGITQFQGTHNITVLITA